MQWTKFGCGHVMALLFLGVAGGCAYILIRAPSVTQNDLVVLGGVMLWAGGIGVGLLVYLWRVVWGRGEETGDDPSEPAEEAAPSGQATRDESGASGPSETSTVPLRAQPDARLQQPEEAKETVDAADLTDAEGGREEAEPTPRLGVDERPWDVREAWRSTSISTAQARTGEENGMLGGIAGILFIGIAVWIALDEPGKWPIAAICAAAGVLAFAVVGYRAYRQQRFGDTTFEMDTMPGILGGPLCGVLHTGVQAEEAPDDGFRVRLSCYHRYITSDNDDNRTVRRRLIWRDEKHMTPFPASTGETLDVPVVFEIPDGLPSSTAKKTASRHMWTVNASAAVPGIDYRSVLEIPVFPVVDDESAPVHAYREYERPATATTTRSRGITFAQHSPGKMEATFGRARRPGVALFMTILTGGIVALTGTAAAAGALVWAVLLGLVSLLSVWGMLHYWTYRSTLVMEGGAIRVTSGIIGLESEVVFPCDALDEVRLVASGGNSYALHLDCSRAVKGEAQRRPMMRRIVRWMWRNQPARSVSENAYLRRYALTDDCVEAATMITNPREAEWMASQIEEAAADCARLA